MVPENPDERFEGARQLWAGRFQAVLVTHSLAEPGYPFPSVVPYCLDREGHPLLLLSHLAQHTKNLTADPRCGLSVAERTEGDVQQTLRLSCPAQAQAVDQAERAAEARWLRYFPASRPYLEQLNFRLYRLLPRRFHFNGGFAAARWLGNERILRHSPFDEAEELRLLAELADLAPVLAAQVGAGEHPLRLAGVDPWGIDLAWGAHFRRLPLPGPLAGAPALRSAILAAVPDLDSAS
jgi:hypothetical protein